MTAFTEACQRPFSNGTEGDAWMAKWCRYCARDHDMHDPNPEGPGCSMVTMSMLGEWPESWIPEPDDGRFSLPSRLVCTAFEACDACGGDPGADARAERVAEVVAYWKERNRPFGAPWDEVQR